MASSAVFFRKNAICQGKKRNKKFFWGFAAPEKEKEKAGFSPGAALFIGAPVFCLSLRLLCVFFVCFFILFSSVHMWGKLGAMWDKGGLERRQLLGCDKLGI